MACVTRAPAPRYPLLATRFPRISPPPAVFVAFHRPLYYGGTRDDNFAQIESLLMQYKVDLVLTGHVHNAQVFCPIYQGACVNTTQADGYDAPIHAVIGNAGQGLTPLAPPNDITRFYASVFGYSAIRIASAETFTMSLYADSDGSELYSFTVNRKYPRTP